jgi:hypothetical protein
MSRFRITALLRPDGVAPRAWDWARIHERLAQRCGELAMSWSIRARYLHEPVDGPAVLVLRVAPDEPSIEAWGELYGCSESLAQALSEALETAVAVVASEVDEPHGAFARYDRGKAVEVEARIADPLRLAARVVGADPGRLRDLVRTEGEDVPGAGPEVDGEVFAEQQWLDHKRREAAHWMERYHSLKAQRGPGGSEEAQG